MINRRLFLLPIRHVGSTYRDDDENIRKKKGPFSFIPLGVSILLVSGAIEVWFLEETTETTPTSTNYCLSLGIVTLNFCKTDILCYNSCIFFLYLLLLNLRNWNTSKRRGFAWTFRGHNSLTLPCSYSTIYCFQLLRHFLPCLLLGSLVGRQRFIGLRQTFKGHPFADGSIIRRSDKFDLCAIFAL